MTGSWNNDVASPSSLCSQDSRVTTVPLVNPNHSEMGRDGRERTRMIMKLPGATSLPQSLLSPALLIGPWPFYEINTL